MITGFNTDVEFEGVIYHVQTEDKGLTTPIILSLVYSGGTILASKRQPYEDLFEGGFDESNLAERLQRQHRLMCAAVQTGRIDDLIQMTRREAEKLEPAVDRVQPEEEIAIVPSEEDDAPIPKPAFDTVPAVELNDNDLEPVVDVLHILDEEVILPDEAVEILEVASDMAGTERPSHNRLSVEFINETAFKGGERKTVTFMVCRGTERKVVGNAQIMVKILGSNFRPQIFHSITDQNGLAKIELDLPSFSAGRGAFLVRASSGGEEIEMRRAITRA